MGGSRADSASNQPPPAGRCGPSATPGPEAALRAALEASGPAVRRYVFGLAGDWDQAEEVAQESLLKAWEKRAGFDGRAEPRTWVFAIARNCWLDRLRRQHSAPRTETMKEQTASSQPAPPAAAARGELAAAVERALAKLPDEQREALALRESEGLTFGQIGQLLGVPSATVKSRVRYALLKLADELAPFGRELES